MGRPWLLALLMAPLPTLALRFAVGDDVECHMSDDAWERGTVDRLHVEHGGQMVPYAVRLASGDTVVAPLDDDRYIRAARLRFAVGDRVRCHLPGDVWEPGTVVQLRVEHEDGKTAPFAVRLDSGDTVVAPLDDDRYIRSAAATGVPSADLSARLLRFAVGARVECNMGGYWERGVVVKINYRNQRDLSGPPAPYQVRLDSGSLVFAPQDDETFVRREGSIQMRDPSLRFGVGEGAGHAGGRGPSWHVAIAGQPNAARGGCATKRRQLCHAGERVECHMGQGRWEVGRVVALHYLEPRLEAAAPYQVRLDAEGALIFVTADDASSIRREQAAGAAARSKLSRSQVGRRASTIGLPAGSQRGGKYGSGPARARPSVRRGAATKDSLARWRAVAEAGLRKAEAAPTA